jgi:hypothetical protein
VPQAAVGSLAPKWPQLQARIWVAAALMQTPAYYASLRACSCLAGGRREGGGRPWAEVVRESEAACETSDARSQTTPGALNRSPGGGAGIMGNHTERRSWGD